MTEPRPRPLTEALERAWSFRESNGSLRAREALRVYHGPTEGASDLPLLAIEKFGTHYWVFEWESERNPPLTSESLAEVEGFLRACGAESAVLLRRPRKGIPNEGAEVLLGAPPEKLVVSEEARTDAFSMPVFEIQFLKTRHPGLFLDHYPLRGWLMKEMAERRVLNTFAYTGSLSVAAGFGGARSVTTLDLSRPTVEWAKRNWDLNGLEPMGPEPRGDFIYGDVFEWLPKFEKRGRRFDAVILDPPSFSRTKSGNFSTSRDLVKLHDLALRVLDPGGYLITSINSEKISPVEFERDVMTAVKSAGRSGRLVQRLSACPETFPRATHLKGLILHVR